MVFDLMPGKLTQATLIFLDYGLELSVCAFLRLEFDNEAKMYITTGEFIDDLLIIKEDQYFEEINGIISQGNVLIREVCLKEGERVYGRKLSNIIYFEKPGESYCWGIDFVFNNVTIQVCALVDEIKVRMVDGLSN